ncbi:MAG: hypothetical protein AAFX99_24135 [Myxococcota bacterium]
MLAWVTVACGPPPPSLETFKPRLQSEPWIRDIWIGRAERYTCASFRSECVWFAPFEAVGWATFSCQDGVPHVALTEEGVARSQRWESLTAADGRIHYRVTVARWTVENIQVEQQGTNATIYYTVDYQPTQDGASFRLGQTRFNKRLRLRFVEGVWREETKGSDYIFH